MFPTNFKPLPAALPVLSKPVPETLLAVAALDVSVMVEVAEISLLINTSP